MKHYYLWYFSLFLLLLACENKTPKITALGTKYIVHKSVQDTIPNPGDYIFFHSDLWIKDSLLYSSRFQGEIPHFQLKEEQQQLRSPSPIEDVLRYLAPGDSVSIEVPITNQNRQPEGFQDVEALYYEVVCINTLPDSVYTKISRPRFEKIRKHVARLILKYNSGRLDDIDTTEGGVKLWLEKKGEGLPVEPGQEVQFDYFGVLRENGQLIDNSFQVGTSQSCILGEGIVLKGLEEGLLNLKRGSHAVVLIPPELAFGSLGKAPKIPPDAELFYYVQIMD